MPAEATTGATNPQRVNYTKHVRCVFSTENPRHRYRATSHPQKPAAVLRLLLVGGYQYGRSMKNQNCLSRKCSVHPKAMMTLLMSAVSVFPLARLNWVLKALPIRLLVIVRWIFQSATNLITAHYHETLGTATKNRSTTVLLA